MEKEKKELEKSFLILKAQDEESMSILGKTMMAQTSCCRGGSM